MHFLWNKRRVSLYLEDRNKGELAPFFRKMHLGFFFDLIFFINHEILFRVIITKQTADFLRTVQFSRVPR